MEVTSDGGPLRVASFTWQSRPGTYVFTVLCKATFVLRQGESSLSPEQDPLIQRDVHWGDDPLRSLRAASDICPGKPRADVVVVGQAYAPGRQPVQSLVARLVVGEVDKSVEVVGDRAFAGGVLGPAARFTQLPLVWERAAAGGANPVGVRGGVPNLQRPGARIASPADVIEPAGFGPIAPTWPHRLERLGRYAAGFQADGWFKAPLPDDFDRSYFNVAPRDQQPASIGEGERIVLENLHPSEARIVTSLPGIGPVANVEAPGAPPRSVQMRCDTLWIDTDRGVCTLAWRGHVPLSRADEPGRVVVSMGRVALPAAAPPAAPPPAASSSDDEAEGTLDISQVLLGAAGPSMPFAPSAAPARADDRSKQSSAGLPFATAPQAPAQAAAPVSMPVSMPVAAPPPMAVAPMAVPPIAAPPMATPMAAPPMAAPPIQAAAPVSYYTPPEQPRRSVSVGEAAVAAAAVAALSVESAPVAAPVSEPVPRVAPAAARAPAPRPQVGEDETLHLIWYDPESVPRIRKKQPWREILRDLGRKPLDPDLDDPAFAKDPMEVEERREVFEILVLAEATDASGVSRALVGAVRDDRKFVPGLVLVAGELTISFDELETLKAAVTTVTPIMGNDENLKASVEAANAFLGAPALLSSPAVAEGLTTRVRDAFSQGKRVLPAGYLDAQIERALLEKRHYKRVAVFGDVFLRGLLSMPGSAQAIPTYLPDGVAKKLPLYQRFKVRIVAEAHLQVDQYESHPAALKAVAIVRSAAPPKA